LRVSAVQSLSRPLSPRRRTSRFGLASSPWSTAARRPNSSRSSDYDPVALGYVQSLARPGGNITGVYLDTIEFAAKGAQLLKEAARLPESRTAATATSGISAARGHILGSSRHRPGAASRIPVCAFETAAQGCRVATAVRGVLTGRGADLI
jgi:hypothetical protein